MWSLSSLKYGDSFTHEGITFEVCDPILLGGELLIVPDFLECLNVEAEEYVELPSYLQVFAL